jgi:hypothetical protein
MHQNTVIQMPTRQVTLNEQRMLDAEIQIYYSNENRSVRRYPPDKVFTFKDDIWPYYKQFSEDGYLGPTISKEDHREQVVSHLEK